MFAFVKLFLLFRVFLLIVWNAICALLYSVYTIMVCLGFSSPSVFSHCMTFFFYILASFSEHWELFTRILVNAYYWNMLYGISSLSFSCCFLVVCSITLVEGIVCFDIDVFSFLFCFVASTGKWVFSVVFSVADSVDYSRS